MNNQIASIMPRRMVYLDVGARGGIGKPWSKFRDCISLIMIEADEDEAQKIAMSNPGDLVIPCALYSKVGTIEINLCKVGRVSSIYKPNIPFLKNFHNLDRFMIEKIVSAKTTTIDTLVAEGVMDVDFAKIDVQGAELSVLKGGRRHLAEEVVGLNVEVEFELIYERQPLFPEVEAFIRDELGMDLYGIRKTFWNHRIHGKMPIWGDALFLRSPNTLFEWSSKFDAEKSRNKLIMALAAGIINGNSDYCRRLFESIAPDFFSDSDKSSWKNIIEKIQ